MDKTAGSPPGNNTMETDDSSSMNQRQRQLSSHECINSRETGDNLNQKQNGLVPVCALVARAEIVLLKMVAMTMTIKSVNIKKKTKTPNNNSQLQNDENASENCPYSCNINNTTSSSIQSLSSRASLMMRPQQCPGWQIENFRIPMRLSKSMFVIMTLPLLIATYVHAGFWTFYFPNFLKPSGYKELNDMIHNLEIEINSTKDAFADNQYFWGLMQELDQFGNDESNFYPEESVCSEVFPLFRDLAIEYAYIDYEHFIQPKLEYHEHLVSQQALWFPEGKKGKTILPREWEQKLYEKDLSLKIVYHTKLAQTARYKKIREQLASIWRSTKRSLDSSIPCIHLRYAIRQVADDINQEALDKNLEQMNEAMEMIKSAYKRIEGYRSSDAAAEKEIEAVLEKEGRYEIRS